MDNIIQQQLDDIIAELRNSGNAVSDPVAKLMVTTLIHQSQKISDEISRIPQCIVSRLSSCFIPRDKIKANPAVCLVMPSLKTKRDLSPHYIAEGASFSFKIDNKQSLSYYPIFKSRLLPIVKTHLLKPQGLYSGGTYTPIQYGRKGQVWLGVEIPTEIESLENVFFFLKGGDGLLPKRVSLNNGDCELTFTVASNIEDIPMAEPFDSQQMSPENLNIISSWKRAITGGDGNTLLTITDPLTDRDAFKGRPYPKAFQQFLESSDLDKFENNTLWLLFDFGADYDVPDSLEIIPNVIPVANVNVNSATLTQSSPIAKLTKNDGSYFLSLLETTLSSQRQGFSKNAEEVMIRDFDASCYNPDELFTDVRNLYNRFIDDYHAFLGYHGLKDGETIKSLRELMNKIGKGVKDQEVENKFDTGTYAMRNVNLAGSISSIKVSYLTTSGKTGNLPKEGNSLENKKDAAIEKDIRVITSASCGQDSATPDQMYEMLRYYTLTNDRLYTKMDIDAFLRFQLLKVFGKEEMKRLSFNMNIQGAPGLTKLQRGLYIGIHFKDKKNYQKALSINLNEQLKAGIEDRSCISMPILISLFSDDINPV